MIVKGGSPIRIISWNVNGLSASIRKGLIKHLRHFSNADNDHVEYLDALSILRHLSDAHPIDRSPYFELQQFFHFCNKSLVSLSFEQIEEITGIRLGCDAYCFKAFWNTSTSPL